MTKQQQAAWKAVNTYRYRSIEKVKNLPELIQLAEEIRQAEFNYQDDFTKESFIAKNIGPTTYQSFTRYGDRKCVTAGLILYWIRLDGLPLDEQAMYMSMDYGHDIHPEELAKFMMDCDRGMSMYEPLRRIEEKKRAFKEITGFPYNYSWIKIHLVVDEQKESMPF